MNCPRCDCTTQEYWEKYEEKPRTNIEYCSLHGAAQELLDACLEAQALIGDIVRAYNTGPSTEAVYQQIQQAIIKAKGDYSCPAHDAKD